MSYARFGWGGSDVYVFATVVSRKPDIYAIDCCGCLLDKGEPLEHPYVDNLGINRTHYYKGFKAFTSGEMLKHFEEHISEGHTVTEETIKDMLDDYPEQNKLITEYENELKGNK